MQLNAVDENQFSSIFGNTTNSVAKPELRENGFEGNSDTSSIFTFKEEAKEPEEKKVLTGDEAAQVLAEGEKVSDDSLFENGATSTKDFTSVKSIFEELIKSNHLLPLDDEKLETPEDVQALLQLNLSHQLEELKKEENNAWYASKSPAWRVVAEFSEKVSHPSELLPFIQSVQTIDDVASLDPKDSDDAEKIVRMGLLSRNESQDIIEETITTYKENGKMTNLAEKYHPAIIQGEKAKLAAYAEQKRQEEVDNYNMIKQIHEDAIKVLEAPFLGKHKMKKEEKAAIYNMIASPDEKNGGYKIFSAIDNLYETKDFEKLRKIALILQDETAYNSYVGLDVAASTAASAIRKLKTTATGHSSDNDVQPEAIKQKQLNRPNLSKDNGFSYFTK